MPATIEVTEAIERGPAPLAPHGAIARYGAPERRAGYVRGLFDRSAGAYDRITQLLCLGSGRWYRQQALRRAGVQAGMTVCDVGCGTGQVALAAKALVGESGRVIGVDPSEGMLSVARAAGLSDLRVGSAESIPLDDDSVDVITMGYALRHVEDLRTAFAEFRRVLKPGGRVLVLELTAPRGGVLRAAFGIYMGVIAPALATAAAGKRGRELMRYYWETIAACVAPEVILRAMADAGLQEPARWRGFGVLSEYGARNGK
jgi:demethylmenaquinone methyltransferase/2-methoxy-6-polyprenyl-1,4-benzoquinol methylase